MTDYFTTANVSIIDTIKQENVKTIPVGLLSRKMVFDEKTNRIYISSNTASVSIIDTEKQKVVQNIPTDITPAGLAFFYENK